MFPSALSVVEHVRTGKLRGLAVTSARRSDALPELEIAAASVPRLRGHVVQLNPHVNAALADAKLKARLGELGGTPLTGSPADFGKLLAEETEKWAKVVKFAGMKPE
jgi:tripartite-type tricarboxylate transporter receptor subunit TctC